MSEPITVIGVNTVVNGNLEGDEDLTIEGRVEGTITLTRTLTIENNGVVHANINVRNAVISGVLVGNVEAEDSVHITEEGRVVGDISAPRVILVDGASFRGSIDMGDFDVERGEATASAIPKTSSPQVSRMTFPAETEQEEAPAKPKIEEVQERPVTRVRPAPSSRSAPRSPAPRTPAAKPGPKKSTPSRSPAKKAPAPKVRSVGKTKAARKKRP
ncbi:MAG: polymer-forming cytoskeletal protein [Myxococcota bacterium]|nr:polymer-forming cytoskeletal protein [Myxococcota bacterium]